MADDSSEPTAGVPDGGQYTPGPNSNPGGGTTVHDVAPVEGRSDGTSDEALEKQASVSRQLPS